jgi:quercetin dioxygenase-like cupin family protein
MKMSTILKRFENPDSKVTFEKGSFAVIEVAGVTLGLASYDPGWKWSTHLRPENGPSTCQVEHVGFVLSGRAVAAMDDGTLIEMKAGDAFYIPPGHDSWVAGDEPYVSLHISGAEQYAGTKRTGRSK